MKTSIAIFVISLLAASLVQVSWVPIPLGLLLILGWFWRNSTKYITTLCFVFSLLLASFSDLPVWLILLSTTAGLYLFILGRFLFPARLPTTFGLVVASIVAWEAVLAGFLRVFNL
jgi:hypothetical protein